MRKGGGDCARGIDGIIEEERNGSRDVGVPAAFGVDYNCCCGKTYIFGTHSLEKRTADAEEILKKRMKYDTIIMENGARRISDACKKD